MDAKNVKEYAGGWITEKKDSEVPGFLKLSYVIVGVCTIAYLFLFLYGETSNADRGPLVQQFNAVAETSPGFMYFVAALAAVFFGGVILFALRKPDPHE